MEINTAREEYGFVCENIRHYSNMRFASMAAFLSIIVISAAISFGTQFSSSPPIWLQTLAKFQGLVVTFIFMIFEIRTNKCIDHFQNRAKELEGILGYKQWSSFPPARFFRADSAFFTLYLLIATFWAIALVAYFTA